MLHDNWSAAAAACHVRVTVSPCRWFHTLEAARRAGAPPKAGKFRYRFRIPQRWTASLWRQTRAIVDTRSGSAPAVAVERARATNVTSVSSAVPARASTIPGSAAILTSRGLSRPHPEREAIGNALRSRLPRKAHGAWKKSASRARMYRRTDGNSGRTPETAGPSPRASKAHARCARVGGCSCGVAPVPSTTADFKRRVTELEAANAALRAETSRQWFIIDAVQRCWVALRRWRSCRGAAVSNVPGGHRPARSRVHPLRVLPHHPTRVCSAARLRPGEALRLGYGSLAAVVEGRTAQGLWQVASRAAERGQRQRGPARRKIGLPLGSIRAGSLG